MPIRKGVFISYSREDQFFLKQLQPFLNQFERAGSFNYWDDSKIQAGMDWKSEIKQALDTAKVAILLISANFLSSKFITEDELPPLLAAAENEGAIILPVIVGRSAFEQFPSLKRFQSANDPKKPLRGLSRAQREQVFQNLADRVRSVLAPPTTPNEPATVAPQLPRVTPSAAEYLVPCARYAAALSEWFEARFKKFEEFARFEGLRKQDPAMQQSVLERIAREVDGFPGGIYAINDDEVSAQYTPLARDVPNIAGYKVTQRPYYEACTEQLRPIVSDALDSANRHVRILVLAVPRFDDAGQFLGILDGVIDVVRAPFCEMARQALKAGASGMSSPKLRLVLIDGLLNVIGASHGTVDGNKNLGGDPLVEGLLSGLSDDDQYSSADGAVSRVDGTQFKVICYRVFGSASHES